MAVNAEGTAAAPHLRALAGGGIAAAGTP